MITKLIKIKEVLALTGLSKSHAYALAHKGLFPKPVKLTERSSAWVQAEIIDWIESRIKVRDEG
ncbi:MAG: AlpA family transcriptional regulator [Colwellia sp.]|nr:AlpA family transcriptional regulator [Colwellia sp.]